MDAKNFNCPVSKIVVTNTFFAAAEEPLQKELITKAYSMLQEGGKLVYSTCSFSYEEDEEVSFYNTRLARLISDASALTKEDWGTTRYEGTFENMQAVLEEATNVKEKENVTSKELETACLNLQTALQLKSN